MAVAKAACKKTTHKKGEIIKFKEINDGSGAQVHITCYNYMACSKSGKYLAVIPSPLTPSLQSYLKTITFVTYDNLTFNYAIQ